MPPAKLLRPASGLLSAAIRRSHPERCSRLCEAAASRSAHTSARSLGRIARLRPTTTPSPFASSPAPSSMPRGARSIFIQTDTTPNPDALKFLPNHPVIPPELGVPFIEYLNARSTIAPPHPSPLAAQLMNTDGVTSVFYGADFITVTKAPDANWAHIKPEIFSLIIEAVSSGQQLVTAKEGTTSASEDGKDGQEVAERDSLAYDENDDEVVGMIKELLETRIRPAIQEDGGDIEFRGFQDGYVMLKLRGACRTCDSSTVTLQNGIEGMLMHYIEEVKGVQQVMDPEEEISIKEFAKFEEKLREQKGPDAAPTTPGKGTLDSVPG
ncbi:scaffold protein Nfu/NifU N terminal-domain-containing protein [Xylaria bambusicola]|uniref:scaffold protein Nfu/NifU N terminal-domain-containing protein n=1 Tax=Xylaria bambusicola TaxID=326684 RepID=UPI002007E8EB|nr:scaffold protein Nfu/NifU N terminal-domain-containing protein [Xylaria bambusicola]KAI0513167.1 scaffold protein Nfu/NifU N terminal-domain-containing protein [Xylaria bambusicola]